MSTWTRLELGFKTDSIVEVQSVYDTLSRHYRMGYVGAFVRDSRLSVYLQTASNSVRMTPRKVFKICKALGALELPRAFKHRDGTLVSEVGVFRAFGRQRGPRKQATNPAGKTVNRSDSFNQTDNRVNTNVFVQINKVGEEDVSHITMEQVKKLVGGSREEVLQMMQEKLPKHVYQNIIDEMWQGLRTLLLNKEYEKCEDAGGSSDDEAPMMKPSDCMDLVVGGEPIRYDGNPHSEYNKEAKKKVATMAILERSAVEKRYSLPHQFAELLFASPHNLNVRHPSNAGYIEYFDGEMWVKEGNHKVDMIIGNWQEKAGELLRLLEMRHGSEWVGSFGEHMASTVLKYSKYEHGCFSAKPLGAHVRRCALLAIDNAEERVKLLKRRTGKRLRRVLSESDFDVRGGSLLRSTTWEELFHGR